MTQLTFGSFSTRSFTLFASTALAIGLSATGLAACGDDGVAPGVDAATIDSGNADTGAADSGGTDTAIVDSGGTDTAVVDSGGTDTPAVDAGPAICTAENPCEGACEGTCGGAFVCNTDVRCTDDIAQYCACDGVTTFTGSGSCPPQGVLYAGACRVSCDISVVTCRAAVPECGELVPSVDEAEFCYGPCVPVSSCRCDEETACPAESRCVDGACQAP